MTDWRPIETAPKDGTEIIACVVQNHGDLYIVNVRWCQLDEDDLHYWHDDTGQDYLPHYWMPLPEIPKKKHFCCGGASELYLIECCERHGNELALRVFNQMGRKSWALVNYCPFCGEAANPTKDEPTIPFGKYKGKKISELPKDFVQLLF